VLFVGDAAMWVVSSAPFDNASVNPRRGLFAHCTKVHAKDLCGAAERDLLLFDGRTN
jgi:hypothetical protein